MKTYLKFCFNFLQIFLVNFANIYKFNIPFFLLITKSIMTSLWFNLDLTIKTLNISLSRVFKLFGFENSDAIYTTIFSYLLVHFLAQEQLSILSLLYYAMIHILLVAHFAKRKPIFIKFRQSLTLQVASFVKLLGAIL